MRHTGSLSQIGICGRDDLIGSALVLVLQYPDFFLIQEIRYHQTGFDEGQLLGIVTHSRLFPWCR